MLDDINNYLIDREKVKQPILIHIDQEKYSISQNKGETEMKNIRKRKDGRWEWRKQINLNKYQLINKNKKLLEQKVREILNQEKEQKKYTIKQKHAFITLIYEWYNTYKKNIKSGKTYLSCIKNHFKNEIFNKDIKNITYLELEKFLQNIKAHRVKQYCYYIIIGTYKEGLKRNYITKDISTLLNKPKNETIKGEHFSLKEQKLILDNLDKSDMKYEILFYLLTGCRREEGCRFKLEHLDTDNNKIFIDRTKRNSTKGYVPISEKFKNIVKNNKNELFKYGADYYTKTFGKYLKKLNIKNHKLHDLRHTYSTNLYYLGVNDKERQYYMGHKSIIMTQDIYTHLDPNITKNDILNLYKDLYPKF